MDAEVSLLVRHALDGQLNLVLFKVFGGQVKLDLSQPRLLAEFLHLDVRKVLALQESLLHCLFHGSEFLAENFGCIEQGLAYVFEFTFGHLADVVAEVVDHHVGGVTHGLDVCLEPSLGDVGLFDFREHAHCAWGFWGDGVASPCYQ